MADSKISQLTAITTIDNANDVLPIVDTSAGSTKKVSVAQIVTAAGVPTDTDELTEGATNLYFTNARASAAAPVQSVNGSTGAVTVQPTLVSGTNIKTVNSTSLLGSGDISITASAAWGGITGTLSSQTDLQSALDGKVDENASIVGATKTKITYDAKGLVTAGADLAAGDLPTGIDAAKIADGTVSNAEFQYIGGLTSDAQTQINGKQATLVSGTNIKTVNSTSLLGSGDVAVQATITGAATTITSSDLTTSRALVSDGSGKVAVSSVTSTELGYVSGVTSAIQTQVDGKLAKFDGTTYDINALACVTQAEYDALTPSSTTIYFIV